MTIGAMPTGPCFVVGPRGYFSFVPTYPAQQSATLLGVINGFFEKSTVYDADGRQWRSKGMECRYRRSWWTVLLANTVYNPRVSVALIWHEPRSYELQELKRAYSKAVDSDDDILTQFVEAAELQERISAARSFDDLVATYRWMETDHDDEHAV